MTLELLGIGVGDAATPTVPPLHAVLTDDAPTVVAVGTERGPMIASLVAAGRMTADRGSVLLDGSTDPDAIRRAVALVDTPFVAEPVPTVPTRSVVREELRFAGLRGRRADAERVLDDLDLTAWSRTPIGELPPTDRIRLLLTLAAARPGVRHLVLTSPERHGGLRSEWLTVAREFSAAGTSVLVIGGNATTETSRIPSTMTAIRAAGSTV